MASRVVMVGHPGGHEWAAIVDAVRVVGTGDDVALVLDWRRPWAPGAEGTIVVRLERAAARALGMELARRGR